MSGVLPPTFCPICKRDMTESFQRAKAGKVRIGIDCVGCGRMPDEPENHKETQMICECCGQFKKIEIKNECAAGEFLLTGSSPDEIRIKFPVGARVGILDMSNDTAKCLLILLHEWESRLGKVAP